MSDTQNDTNRTASPQVVSHREAMRRKIISKCQADGIEAIDEVAAHVSRCISGNSLSALARDLIAMGELTEVDLLVEVEPYEVAPRNIRRAA